MNRENREIRTVSSDFLRELNRNSEAQESKSRNIRQNNRLLIKQELTRSFNKDTSHIQSIKEEEFEDEEGEDGRRPSSTGIISVRRFVLVPVPCSEKPSGAGPEDETQTEELHSWVSDSNSDSFRSLERLAPTRN